jgi:hypothetical protein
MILGRVISSQVHRVARVDGLGLTMFGELGHEGLEMLLGTFDLVEAVVIGATGQAGMRAIRPGTRVTLVIRKRVGARAIPGRGRSGVGCGARVKPGVFGHSLLVVVLALGSPLECLVHQNL